MAWTTLEAEASILSTAALSPRVAVDTIGQSVQGRPIRAVRIGATTPPADDARVALLVLGCQHGHEPAGREAMLQLLLPALIGTSDSGLLTLLGSHGVVLVPTVNPDGFAALSRENANIVDLNRDHVTLSQPETRAVASLLGQHRPLMVLDCHETTTAQTHGADVAFRPCSNPQITSQVQAHSDALLAAVQARMTTDGWSHSLYGDDPPSGRENRMLNNAGLRHSVPLLIESHGFGGSALPDEDRRDIQHAVMDEALAYLASNVATVRDDIDAGIAGVIADGAAGSAFDLHTGDVLNPAPLGYRLSGAQFAATVFHRQVFNVTASGSVVSMAQMAQPIIPHLLDPDGPSAIVAATRLFDLTPVAGAVTVTDPAAYAPLLSGSHSPVFEATVLSTFQAGDEPDGEQVPIVAGQVTMDGTAQVQRSLDLTTIGLRMFPRRAGDLLLPDSTEVFVRRGIDLGAEIWWAPLGYFRIQTTRQDDAPHGTIRLTGYDRMKAVIDSTLIRPRQFSAGRTFGSVIAELVHGVHPAATILWDDDTEHEPIGRPLLVEQSRYEPMLTLVQGRGKVMAWDGQGVLRIRTAPDPTLPVWEVRAGRAGVLSVAAREVTRDDVVNAVVVRSQGGDALKPARAVVIDDGPHSITRFGGRFGQVPEHITVPATSTAAQVQDAARDILRRRAGLPYRVEFGAVVNPALTPYDPVRVTLRDGTRERHVVERLTIPLTTEAIMTASTREQRSARVVVANL